MSADGARRSDALPPESKAMLSLLLVQGRSYQEIADMLHMSPVNVRERAHAAAGLLVGNADQQPSPAGRARIIDYLLGEQSVSERELTRSELSSLAVSRAWAKRLAASLATLATEPLPSIPGPAAAPPETPPAAAPAPAPPAVAPPPGSLTARPEADRRPTPPPPPQPPRGGRRPRHWLIPSLLLAAVAAAVVIIVIASGGSSPPGSASTPAVSGPTGTSPGKSGGRTIRRLVLVGTASSNKAFGAGAVISQHGKLLLLLQARGLAPNHHNFYGVWLYNAPGDARLLGFVAPAVGADGRFSSSVPLPDDAVRFHSLIVTLEPTDLPKRPGSTVLRSPLSLS